MADRIDALFQEWHRLGAAVLLAESDPAIAPRQPEEVVAESTMYCRASGRLTWIVLDWLIHNIADIDKVLLLEKMKTLGDLTVLGVLCDAAYQRNPDKKFEQVMLTCKPQCNPEPFFWRVARSPLASRMAHENNLDVFQRWNYFSNELRYLGE